MSRHGRRSTLVLTPLAVAAVALVIAGCGGGSGKTTTTSATSGGSGGASSVASQASSPAFATDEGGISHDELVSRADAACTSASAQIRQVPVATTLAGLGQYASQVAMVSTTLHRQLLQYEPSISDRAAYQAYLEALQTSNEQLAAMQKAAARHDEDGVRTAASAIVGADVGTLAARVGLGACASATATPGS